MLRFLSDSLFRSGLRNAAKVVAGVRRLGASPVALSGGPVVEGGAMLGGYRTFSWEDNDLRVSHDQANRLVFESLAACFPEPARSPLIQRRGFSTNINRKRLMCWYKMPLRRSIAEVRSKAYPRRDDKALMTTLRYGAKQFLCVIVCLVAFALSTVAQAPLATVTGRVLDPNGAIIIEVTVTASNVATGIQVTTHTNEQGIYYFTNLDPGNYEFVVTKIGFAAIRKPGIALHVADTVSMNFAMKVGAINETVTVEGGAPLVNTENAAVSTVIDRKFVEGLPLNGRSFNTLLQLTPGVIIGQQPVSGASPGQFSISGQRTSANNFSVDGVSANFGVSSYPVPGNSGTGSAQAFSASGGTSSLASVDALQEFRIETSSFAPEFGRSPGGQVSLTTRAGTNVFHGGVFEYFRNDVLDANNWFSDAASPPIPKAAERHNDFGGVVGGPIVKNKTFFFFSYEGARLRNPQTVSIQVPSADARAGLTSPAIPAAVLPYLRAYPVPNGPASADTFSAQFIGSYSNQNSLDATSVRIDHRINERFSLFGRYNYAPSSAVNRTGSLSNIDAISTNTRTVTAGLNMLLNSRMSNTFRANYSTQAVGDVSSMDSFGGAIPPDPSLLVGSLSPSASRGSFQPFDVAPYYIGPLTRNHVTQLNFVDDFGVTIGTNQVKMGVDYRDIFLEERSFDHLAQYTASKVMDLANPGAVTLSMSTQKPSQLFTQVLSLYAQDTWKVMQRLTITYGLRWELAPAPSGRGATTLASWQNTGDLSQTSLAPIGTPLWSTTYGNVAPRVGAAYSLSQQGDFVLRAGLGIFYDVGVGQAASAGHWFPNSAVGTPTAVSLPVSDLSPFEPLLSLQPPYGFIVGFDPHLSLPHSYQWNVALEKSFHGNQGLSATYVGQSGRDLFRNEAFAATGNFQGGFELTRNTAGSNYNAFQLQYKRPLSARVQALLNYTWSHSLDNSSDDTIQVVPGGLNVISGASDYASSDFDDRHIFSGAVTLDIPSARRSGVLSMMTRDWSLNGIVVARAGFPFNAQVLGLGVAGTFFTRPDLVSGQPIWLYGAQCIATLGAPCAGGRGLNSDPLTGLGAFTIPSSPRQGTEGRNDIRGFGLTQVDLSLSRKFPVTERLDLRFRVDAFNVPNHPNFTNPFGYIGLGGFGQQSLSMLNQGIGGLNSLFQQGGPRSLQLSLRLDF